MEKLQQTIINDGRTEASNKQEKHIQIQINERERQEEIQWKQKSRIKWLKEGERNTKFFHRSTIQRRIHNNITHIHNQQG